jgi:hypothetical protein
MGESDPSFGFGLFVSSVEGQPVSRFGGGGVMIGASRDLSDRKLVHYTPEIIVGIPHEEARKYAREYRRAISDGSLKERTAAEWAAQNDLPAEPAPEPVLEPEPAAEPDPEPDSDPVIARSPEPETTRKDFTMRQARLSTPMKADDLPDKDEAPSNADHQSRR